MAGPENERLPEANPALSDELRGFMREARERVAEAATRRDPSDTTRRPYSLRLNTHDVGRLQAMAALEGGSASELARRLVLEGLLRLEEQRMTDATAVLQKADVLAHLHEHVEATRRLLSRLRHDDGAAS
jgi:hypothetical protein